MTKAKTLVEQMLEDFTKISHVQQSVLLQKNFVTSDDSKTMILNMNLDYLGDKRIPICKLKELIMLLKLKIGKNVDISFTDEFIEIQDDSLKTIYRYSEESLVMHIDAINKNKMISRLEKPEKYIKINLTSDDQLSIKRAMGVFAEPLLAIKKTGDFIRFIVFDKTKPEKCLFEALSLPIENCSLKDFDIVLMDKNNFFAINNTDYSFYICLDYKGEREFIKFILDGDIKYSISSTEPLVENFDIKRFNNFIEKFLKTNEKKTEKKEKASKKKEKRVVEEEIERNNTESDEVAPVSLDDIDIDDFEEFDI